MKIKQIMILGLGLAMLNTTVLSAPVVGPSPGKSAAKPKSVNRAVAKPAPAPAKKAVKPKPVKRAVRN